VLLSDQARLTVLPEAEAVKVDGVVGGRFCLSRVKIEVNEEVWDMNNFKKSDEINKQGRTSTNKDDNVSNMAALLLLPHIP